MNRCQKKPENQRYRRTRYNSPGRNPLHLGAAPKPMDLSYPKSFPRLLLAGFSLVALPLLTALVHNAVTMAQLAKQSQQAVYQAVRATHGSRVMLEELTIMERSIRQYAVLGDPPLLEGYFLAHRKFQETASRLAALSNNKSDEDLRQRLIDEELSLFQYIAADRKSPAVAEKAKAGFPALFDLAKKIENQGNALIENGAESLEKMAGEAQRRVLWQLLALTPLVLLLVAGFSILITKPIRQIQAVIRRLGEGRFADPIRVDGPRDLEQLGADLEWMRSRLNELEQQKTLFLSQISHELKTPLTALREGAELLAEEATGALTPPQREVVEILRHNSTRLQRLIENLLRYQSVMLEKSALKVVPTPLRPLIAEAEQAHALALRAKNLKLEVHCPDDSIQADAEKLAVMLDNLLSNAIKFSPPGTAIRIAAQRADDWIQIDVIDEGPGIPGKEREQVFKMLYQGGAPHHGRVAGTGLGLAIVREYAAAHGGTAEALDSATGAHLRISLPLRPAAQESP